MGPLSGIRVVEMAGLGPAPFCGMTLADLGAEVIRVDRRESADLGIPGREPRFEVLNRGRRSISVDVKSAGGREDSSVKRSVTPAIVTASPWRSVSTG